MFSFPMPGREMPGTAGHYSEKIRMRRCQSASAVAKEQRITRKPRVKSTKRPSAPVETEVHLGNREDENLVTHSLDEETVAEKRDTDSKERSKKVVIESRSASGLRVEIAKNLSVSNDSPLVIRGRQNDATRQKKSGKKKDKNKKQQLCIEGLCLSDRNHLRRSASMLDLHPLASGIDSNYTDTMVAGGMPSDGNGQPSRYHLRLQDIPPLFDGTHASTPRLLLPSYRNGSRSATITRSTTTSTTTSAGVNSSSALLISTPTAGMTQSLKLEGRGGIPVFLYGEWMSAAFWKRFTSPKLASSVAVGLLYGWGLEFTRPLEGEMRGPALFPATGDAHSSVEGIVVTFLSPHAVRLFWDYFTTTFQPLTTAAWQMHHATVWVAEPHDVMYRRSVRALFMTIAPIDSQRAGSICPASWQAMSEAGNLLSPAYWRHVAEKTGLDDLLDRYPPIYWPPVVSVTKSTTAAPSQTLSARRSKQAIEMPSVPEDQQPRKKDDKDPEKAKEEKEKRQ
jgi:hypothetical protein